MKQMAKHIALSATPVFQSELFDEQTTTMLLLLTSNVASEGRRSAQHGGVPSTGWLGDEANLASKPIGLPDAECQQNKWSAASRGV